jgi:hypothetical protein
MDHALREPIAQGEAVTESRFVAPLVRWGAVFSGTVIGLALTLLAGSLWVALAFSSHEAVFYNHLAWWLAGTAIAATFIAAWIAGAVSGTAGIMAGLANGLTTWGLLVLGVAAAGGSALGIYGATRPITVNGVQVAVTTVSPWTAFWALLIGLGAALLGGFVGGAMQRRRIVSRTLDLREPVARTVETPVAATR